MEIDCMPYKTWEAEVCKLPKHTYLPTRINLNFSQLFSQTPLEASNRDPENEIILCARFLVLKRVPPVVLNFIP